MIKKYIRKYLPEKHQIIQHKYLSIFGDLLHNPNLWHLNRRSVARAFTIGLFFAWVPVPFQMVLAAAGAIALHANIAISVALVWLTNPITMPALFYFAYKIGACALGIPAKGFSFELSMDWLISTFQHIGKPFLLGCLLCGLVSAVLGNLGIRFIWRCVTIHHWRKRRGRRSFTK